MVRVMLTILAFNANMIGGNYCVLRPSVATAIIKDLWIL